MQQNAQKGKQVTDYDTASHYKKMRHLNMLANHEQGITDRHHEVKHPDRVQAVQASP